jgi:uncharacterized protein YraI
MEYAVEMASCSMIFLPSFMKINKGVQALFRFCLSNMNGCNVGSTNGKDLSNAPLRWAQVA